VILPWPPTPPEASLRRLSTAWVHNKRIATGTQSSVEDSVAWKSARPSRREGFIARRMQIIRELQLTRLNEETTLGGTTGKQTVLCCSPIPQLLKPGAGLRRQVRKEAARS